MSMGGSEHYLSGSPLTSFIKLFGITNFVGRWPHLTWITNFYWMLRSYLSYLLCYYLSVRMAIFIGILFATTSARIIVICSPMSLTRISWALGIMVACSLLIVVALKIIPTLLTNFALIVSRI